MNSSTRTAADLIPRQGNLGPDPSAICALVRPFEAIAYLYANLETLGEQQHALRWRSIANEFTDLEAPALAVNSLAVRYAKAEPTPATLALFSAADGTMLHEQWLSDTKMQHRTGYAAPPSVVPLLGWEQERPPYVLVVVDRAGADLTASTGGSAVARTWKVTGPDDEIERNAPGGWSQPRYRRRAEDSWRHNAKYVAGEVTKAVAGVHAQVIVMSGDVRAVQLLANELPRNEDLLVRRISGSRTSDGSQVHRDDQVAWELKAAAAQQTRSLLDLFHSHLNPGGLSVEGTALTVAALSAGRVATLLVTDDLTDHRDLWFGESATDIFLDHESALASKRPVRRGRLADVAIRAALLSGAQVRVIPATETGAPEEGIGAVGRFGAQ